MAYMKKLAAQKPHFRRGHTLMVQLLAAGEFPVNVIAYGYQVEYMKAQGASLDWAADEPVDVESAGPRYLPGRSNARRAAVARAGRSGPELLGHPQL